MNERAGPIFEKKKVEGKKARSVRRASGAKPAKPHIGRSEVRRGGTGYEMKGSATKAAMAEFRPRAGGKTLVEAGKFAKSSGKCSILRRNRPLGWIKRTWRPIRMSKPKENGRENMAVLELTKEQIFDLVRQMPAEQRREVLFLLAANAPGERAKRQQFAEEQLRRACAARGLDWDALSADEREAFIDDLIHEDRPCAR
jgi:hypothetical protein